MRPAAAVRCDRRPAWLCIRRVWEGIHKIQAWISVRVREACTNDDSLFVFCDSPRFFCDSPSFSKLLLYRSAADE